MIEGIGNLTSLSHIFPNSVVKNINLLIKIFQALGGIIILYFVFQIINIILRRSEKRLLKKINKNLEEIKNILKKEKNKRKKER